MWINPLIGMILGIGQVCGLGWLMLRFWPYIFSVVFILATIYEVWNVFICKM